MSDQTFTFGSSLPLYTVAESMQRSEIDPVPFGINTLEGPIFEFAAPFTAGQWLASLPCTPVVRPPLFMSINGEMLLRLMIVEYALHVHDDANFWLATGMLEDVKQTKVRVVIILDDDAKPKTVLMQRLTPIGCDTLRPLCVQLS